MLGLAAAALTACDQGLEAIDRRTLALLDERTREINAEVLPQWPRPDVPSGNAGPIFGPDPVNLRTRNPSADQIGFTPRSGSPSDDPGAAPETATATLLNLAAAIGYAVANSREYQTAAEAYVIQALNLLIERHRWGPRFFDQVRTEVSAVGDDGVFDAAQGVVNDLSVRQRLPYGGEVSASLLAAAAWDLNRRVGDSTVQDADIILRGDIPLLRGAGLAAREDLIQAERNLIYAAREFERFRREFVFAIASDYLDLVVRSQAISNAIRQVQAFEQAEQRELALFRSGRQAGFQAGLAAQDTLFARDRLASQEEQFKLAIDRFKVRIGMPTEQPMAIEVDSLGLPAPAVAIDQAVAIGLRYRLDLQNERDRLADAQRRVDVARNNLLPDLNLSGFASIPTDPDKRRAGVDFSPGDANLGAGVTLDIPLDREIERARLRQAQIAMEQVARRYSQSRDTIAVNIRSAVRNIDLALFSIRIQEQNVRIAKLREASIAAAPDRASARDRSDAIEARLRAEDSLAVAQRDLQVAILGYLLATDQLRVGANGAILPLDGMTLTR
ncbi:MAG TPA: TolC family protein [Phycisphaerales bacterium]|nr:TolC family protein [Phycisphaerales bacterium]HMP37538.1 TolC family protein [Phycisphaerales bacterium]